MDKISRIIDQRRKRIDDHYVRLVLLPLGVVAILPLACALEERDATRLSKEEVLEEWAGNRSAEGPPRKESRSKSNCLSGGVDGTERKDGDAGPKSDLSDVTGGGDIKERAISKGIGLH